MLKIWGLYIKGLQSYQPSNFENDWTLGQLESEQTGSNRARAERQTFSRDLQLGSPLIKGPHMHSIKRSKPSNEACQKSSG